jgi:hypothetical protein
MKLPKGTLVLSMDSPTFAENFAEAIGLKPGEKLEIKTPQFERTDGVQVPVTDFSKLDWESLPMRGEATLKALGLGIWDKEDDYTHWLYPKEWYTLIPDGLAITSINGDNETFVRGETDDDYRFGCLSFGFIQRTAK